MHSCPPNLAIHYLEQQLGAKISLAIIVIIVLLIVVQQAYYFRFERRINLPPTTRSSIANSSLYLCITVASWHKFTNSTVIVISRLTPRFLHQWSRTLGIWCYLPNTRKSLRWCSAWLPASIRPGTGNFLSSEMSNISFTWAAPPLVAGYDRISILVNDVERYRRGAIFVRHYQLMITSPGREIRPRHYQNISDLDIWV